MKVHTLMENQVAKIQPHRPPPTSVPAYTIHRTGEDWGHTNNTTVEVKIHPGQMNVVIFPETGKSTVPAHLLLECTKTLNLCPSLEYSL